MFIFFEMSGCSSGDDAAHAMSNHIDDNILLLVFLHVVADETLNFLCCLLPHLSNVSFCIVLVGFGNEEVCIGQLLHYPSLDQKHVIWGALETMKQNHQHMLLGVL